MSLCGKDHPGACNLVCEVESSVPGAVGEREPLDVERLDLLAAFIEWADDWLEEKARREAWPMMPGTMPPASFADRPAALNRELVALKDRAARLSVNEGDFCPICGISESIPSPDHDHAANFR